MVLLSQAPTEESLDFVSKLLSNADKITVEVIILVVVLFVLRFVGRSTADQSKETVELIKWAGSAQTIAQENTKALGELRVSVQQVTEDVIENLTKSGGMLSTVLLEQRQLISAVQNYAKIQMNLPLGLMGVRGDGTIVSINEHAVELLGIPPEKIVGSNIKDWKHDDVLSEDGVTHIPEKQFPIYIALTEKRTATRIAGFINPTYKKRVWLLVKAEPSFDANGTLSRVMIVYQDVGMLMTHAGQTIN